MTTIAQLEARVAEARAAWEAAGKPRGDHPLFLAGVAANKALAAARKAARPSEDEQAARLAELQRSAMEAQRDRERAEKEREELARAAAAVDAAWSYPRQGEGWGDYPGEQRAIRVLSKHGLQVDEMGRIVGVEKK